MSLLAVSDCCVVAAPHSYVSWSSVAGFPSIYIFLNVGDFVRFDSVMCEHGVGVDQWGAGVGG